MTRLAVSPEDVMAQERAALLGEYLYPNGVMGGVQVPPYCAIPDWHVLRTTPTPLRQRHPIQLIELPGSRPGHAVVQLCPSLDYAFLWAHVDNDNYRSDYVRFLGAHHNLTLTSLPRTYHVDHLFNRARARSMALPWVRMVLLPSFINVSHGGGYEGSRTRGGIGRPGRPRGIDEIVLLKLCGVSSPRQGMPLTPQMRVHLARMAALFHLPAAELERNIAELMQVARFRPQG
ncbi:hypothetical protein [Limobrevibacterium gyesilva]|uniref:Uncharacterized protein n=1 Tax=Limobrevibacterium gyesilva TaxID=2991712 RepID=A0AA42CHM7_9PROT|nr:hypothetical protein [Limobrevibacterium gyesilva]MCW3477421.1 hypothetical protein [Limobrevibacterium gyesilva]